MERQDGRGEERKGPAGPVRARQAMMGMESRREERYGLSWRCRLGEAYRGPTRAYWQGRCGLFWSDEEGRGRATCVEARQASLGESCAGWDGLCRRARDGLGLASIGMNWRGRQGLDRRGLASSEPATQARIGVVGHVEARSVSDRRCRRVQEGRDELWPDAAWQGLEMRCRLVTER